MKKIILLLFTIGAAIFVIADSGWAFRCGNDLVTTGYNKVQVLSICGEPTNKEQSCLEHHRETGVCIIREKYGIITVATAISFTPLPLVRMVY